MRTNQYHPTPYYGSVSGHQDERGFFLPFLAGLALTAPFWWGRRCCGPYYGGGFGGGFGYPLPQPFPYPYPLPTPYPYTFNTYAGVVGSPYSYYNNQPFIY